MTDWDDIILTLKEMKEYFLQCAGNARDGGRMRKRYTHYTNTIDRAVTAIREALDKEEDDRK